MNRLDGAETSDDSPQATLGFPTFVWLAFFAVIAIWVANRLGVFDLWSTVIDSNGKVVRLPNVYGTVDHPFHATRAELLLRALRDGHPLRWIGSHQGGYPAEFYPLGVAGLDVALWAIAIGSLPIVIVHKLAIIFIFLAPGAAYGLMARRDRMSLGIAVVALAAHAVVRGWWWSGGSYELIEWGLVTNVAAAVSALFVLLFLTSFLNSGRGQDAGLAIIFGSFCIYSNPRSSVALAIVGIGSAIAVLSVSPADRARLRILAQRLALTAIAVAFVAAPEIVSLIRFEHLYYFVKFERYADLDAYWHSSIQAVSGPVFVAGIIGVATSIAIPNRPIIRSASITLVVYCLVTAYLSVGSAPGSVIEQLETTRLMPFQRLLTIFVAAVAVHDVADWLLNRFSRARLLGADFALAIVAGLLPFVYVIAPPGFIPEGDRGLVDVPTAATTGIADLRESIEFADQEANPGTAILILGSTLSWHSQLWAPDWSERQFFYDDWLWYWQTHHVGPYDPLTEHAYSPAEMASVLDNDYLKEHGIGAVIMTETARTAAAVRAASSATNLTLAKQGVYDVYLVNSPTTIVTLNGANVSAVVDDQSISASVNIGSRGTAVIRRNWYPRWRARVNGKATAISETADGYMSVSIPSGDVRLELRYIVDIWDWLARGLCVLGIAVTVFLTFGSKIPLLKRYTQGSMGTSIMVGRSRERASVTASESSSGEQTRTPGMR